MRSTYPVPGEIQFFPKYLQDAGYHTTNNREKDHNTVDQPEAWYESSSEAHYRDREEGQLFFHVRNITISHENSLHDPIDTLIHNPDQPFFLYLAYDTPHAGLEVASSPYPEGGGLNGGVQWIGENDNFINTVDGSIDDYIHSEYAGQNWPEAEERFASMIRRFDSGVGDIIQLLKDLDIDENTMIVFTSDNGPHRESYGYGDHTPAFFESFGPLDGIKRDTWEGGIRVPTLVRRPGHIPAGTDSDASGGFHDWLPTFAELGGLPAPARTDGVSLLPVLTGESKRHAGQVYIEYSQNGRRTPDYPAFESSRRNQRRGQMQVLYLDGYKAVLSQSPFCGAHTMSKGATHDRNVPQQSIPERGEYPSGDYPARDMDTNGWPQKGRDEALRIIRKGFALHIAGDQHLGSVVHYGVEEYGDAGFVFTGPALNNIWPRRWWPTLDENHRPLAGRPKYTGNFKDAFSNRMTVLAVANPVQTNREPALIYDRVTGYGIVTFDKTERTVTMECWPRYVDPHSNPAGQYDGWPVIVDQQDNYGRQAVAYLPEISVQGLSEPVIQIYNENSDELEYALRIKDNSFKPKIFKREDSYTIRIGDPDRDLWQEYSDVRTGKKDQKIICNFT